MKVYIALYDPSQPSDDGSFWAWKSAHLDKKLLDRLYYDFAREKRPENPNLIKETDIIAGTATLDPNWIFAYRFGNGGRDIHGRPGRFVMMVAGFQMNPPIMVDLEALITHEVFTDVLTKAPFTCPIPSPTELELDFDGPQIGIANLPTLNHSGPPAGLDKKPFFVSIAEPQPKQTDSAQTSTSIQKVFPPEKQADNDQLTTQKISFVKNKIFKILLHILWLILFATKMVYFFLIFKPITFIWNWVLNKYNKTSRGEDKPAQEAPWNSPKINP